jgi:hypothetical protein
MELMMPLMEVRKRWERFRRKRGEGDVKKLTSLSHVM